MMGSTLARASMQWRMSPGGGMPMSRRSTPDPPPSSATVTTAVRFRVYFFKPRSMVDSPVPPPMAVILGPRSHCWALGSISSIAISSLACVRLQNKRLYVRPMSRWLSVTG